MLEEMFIEGDRTPHRLRGVAQQRIETRLRLHQIAGENLHGRRMPQIEPVDAKTSAPVRLIRLGAVAPRGVVREAGGDDDAGPRPEQLESGLVADLQPGAADVRGAAGQIRRLEALGVIELGAPRAQAVIEMMDLVIRLLARVAATPK